MEIKVKISLQSIWGDFDADENGIDDYESCVALCESIENHIHAEYPNAQIEVLTAFENSVLVDGQDETENDIAQHVNQLVDKAWNGDDWMVAA